MIGHQFVATVLRVAVDLWLGLILARAFLFVFTNELCNLRAAWRKACLAWQEERAARR